MDISDYRREFQKDGLRRKDLNPSPFDQFEKWYLQAREADLIDTSAMTVATVSSEGKPSQRTVLLKFFDEDGFVFFTNYGSQKAQEIDNNANVSLLFSWNELERQIEISGTAVKTSEEESYKYFHSRPRGSQLGAWTSTQSAEIESREALDAKLDEAESKFPTDEIPLPHWGGFRVIPHTIEFWQGGARRLHDRFEYSLNETDDWVIQRLQP